MPVVPFVERDSMETVIRFTHAGMLVKSTAVPDAETAVPDVKAKKPDR
jgi:hypothetical protein